MTQLKIHYMKIRLNLSTIAVVCAIGLSSCATNDNPPCRRVTAKEFMRPHTFKGIPTDQFIGVTGAPNHFTPMKGEGKAFKHIWEMGVFHGWAIIWCPTDELSKDYLSKARQAPN
jgi:hypothetical protein